LDVREVLIKEIMHYKTKTQINRIQWHDMRLFFPQELDAYLQWSGFTIMHKFGSFEETEFNDTSDKQIFVCKTTP